MSALARQRRRSRGFSLLLALTLITVLSVSVAMLLGQVGDFAVISGASTRRQKLLLDAEAGLNWGVGQVSTMLYPGGTGPTLSGIQALPALGRQDALCPDVDCSTWRLLQAAQPVGSEGATARVAVTCVPGDCSVSPASLVNLYIRSLGGLPGGDGRLLEATLALP